MQSVAFNQHETRKHQKIYFTIEHDFLEQMSVLWQWILNFGEYIEISKSYVRRNILAIIFLSIQ